jgi:hypothetical protein
MGSWINLSYDVCMCIYLNLDNEKIEKQEASKTIRKLFGARALLIDKSKEKLDEAAKSDSACDRDGDVLRDQVCLS